MQPIFVNQFIFIFAAITSACSRRDSRVNGRKWNQWDNTDYAEPTCNFRFLEEQVQMGEDPFQFELKCTFPNEPNQRMDCFIKGVELPDGTIASLKCHSDYNTYGANSKTWRCDGGIWEGGHEYINCVRKGEDIISYDPENSTSYDDASGKIDIIDQYDYDSKLIDEYLNSRTKESPGEIPEIPENPNENESVSKYPDLGINYGENGHDLTDQYLNSKYVPPLESKPSGSEQHVGDLWVKFLETFQTTPATTTPPTTPKPTTPGWSAPTLPLDENSDKMCPPLSLRQGISLECISKVSNPQTPDISFVSHTNCSTPQPMGSEATYKCEQFYESTLGRFKQYRKCKRDGTWSGGNQPFSCNLECGKFNPGKTPYITNGEKSTQAQWPWHATLFYNNEFICGGTLITSKAVVTAAHCVLESANRGLKILDSFRIDLGRYRRTHVDEYVQTFGVESIIPHPSYNDFVYDSDIAIIILDEPVTIGYHVRPVCYPQTQRDELVLFPGSVGIAVGFGANEKNEYADVLQMARLQVVGNQECLEGLSGSAFGAAMTKSTTFCTAAHNGTNVCNGDSGGGIYFPVTSSYTSRWYLQGLVSVGLSLEGARRCDPKRNAVFTKVAAYDDWILRTLSDHDALL